MSTLLTKFHDWLKAKLSTEASANSYFSRLKRAFKIWDKYSSNINPIEDYIDMLKVLAQHNPSAFQAIIDQMLAYLEEEQSLGCIKPAPANDVATAIRTFEHWCKDVTPPVKTVKSVPQNIISNIFNSLSALPAYSIKSLNLRARIASRDSEYWPARKLGSLIGNKKEGSWITETLKHVIVLTDHGIHHIKDIDWMKVDSDDFLYVHPWLYKNDEWPLAMGYHADGSIHPLKVARDKNGNPDFSSITLEHSPAVSIIIKSGKFPEFSKLIAGGKTPDQDNLKKEFSQINHIVTYMLMERGENSAKGNKW